MPAYQFYRLSDLEASPLRFVFFADAAAGRYALGAAFPSGADVWQDGRFVGRFHGQTALLNRPAGGLVEATRTWPKEAPTDLENEE
jgi:hypothetical protein